jgi:hypothetical protein
MVYLGMKNILCNRNVTHGLVGIVGIRIGGEDNGSGNFSINIIVDKMHW